MQRLRKLLLNLKPFYLSLHLNELGRLFSRWLCLSQLTYSTVSFWEKIVARDAEARSVEWTAVQHDSLCPTTG